MYAKYAKLAPIIALVLAVLLYAWGNKIPGCKHRQPTPTPTPVPKTTPTPTPKPTPIYIPQKHMETGKMFNGMEFRARLESEPGSTTTVERDTPGSYAVEVTVKVKVPKANDDLASLSKLNPELPKLLPGLPAMLEKARVSDKYETIYGYKLNLLRTSLTRLDALQSRHDFFDCETILELRHPRTKRTAVLLQADMDVDTDGSDPDRLPVPNASDPTFQPMTSYKWPKQTELVSPFLAPKLAKLKAAEAKLAESKGLSAGLRQVLRDQVGAAQFEVHQLKNYSFLIAATDPYVVLPGLMQEGMPPGFQPKVGDYCAVIHGNMIYPAIIGDIGPKKVVGEASLRLGKEINSETTGLHRSENNLKVTYLFFPGSADETPGPPDLDQWRAKVESLLNEIGGYGGNLHAWVNLSKPAPTPTPPPTPTPTPSPSPSPSPAPSASPGASPVCPSVTPSPGPTVSPSATPSPSPSATPKKG